MDDNLTARTVTATFCNVFMLWSSNGGIVRTHHVRSHGAANESPQHGDAVGRE